MRADDAVEVLWCGLGEPLQEARVTARRLCAAVAWERGLAERQCSRSATVGLGAVAVRLAGCVGVDVQSEVPVSEALLEEALSPRERGWLVAQGSGPAFATLWTRKEAVLKAFGVGLAFEPRRVCVVPSRTGWQRVEVTGLGVAWVCGLAAPGGAVAAVAVCGPTPPGRLEVRTVCLRRAGESGSFS